MDWQNSTKCHHFLTHSDSCWTSWDRVVQGERVLFRVRQCCSVWISVNHWLPTNLLDTNSLCLTLSHHGWLLYHICTTVTQMDWQNSTKCHHFLTHSDSCWTRWDRVVQGERVLFRVRQCCSVWISVNHCLPTNLLDTNSPCLTLSYPSWLCITPAQQ